MVFNEAYHYELIFSGETSDIVPFFTGLLLASDSKTKDWIADYIKAVQKVNASY